MTRSHPFQSVFVALGTLLGATAAAQDPGLEEIIVTARKRVENAQDVPISVSVVNTDRLREIGATELSDIASYVPNFTLNETGITTTIAIRGISSGINQGFEQSVGMYVDGIYYGRGQLARAPLFDMQRIEVARGPQPISFGKNSIAGAVSMLTAKPTDEFEASVTAAYGAEYGEENLQLALSGPFADNFRARLSVFRREADGYLTNVFLNRKEKQEKEGSVRASFAWEPTERVIVDLKLEHSEFDTVGRNTELVHSVALPTGGVDYFTALGRTVTTYNDAVAAGVAQPPSIPYLAGDELLNRMKSSGTDEHDNDVDNVTLNIDYYLGAHRLTLLTGYVAYDSDQLCDCDFVSAPIIDGSTTAEKFDQFSQEIRLTSPGGDVVDYIAGLYYQTNDLVYKDTINLPADGVLRALSPAFANIDTRRSFEQDSSLLSAFAQLTWNLSPVFRLTGGGRYTTEHKQATRDQVHHARGAPLPPIDPTGVTPNALWGANPLFGAFMIEPYAAIGATRSESKFTPLLTAEWDAAQRVMLYGTYVTGFKSGGFDTRSNGHPDAAVVNALNVRATPPADIVGVFEYQDEHASAIEVGAKMSLAGRAELNAALYQTDYEDLQTSVFDGTLGFNVVNAASATIRGIELDSRWMVTAGLTVSASLAYLDFEFDEFTVAQCYFNDPRPRTGPGTCDATGDRREYTPEWTGALIAEYERPAGNRLTFRTTAELIYSDDYIWSPTLDPLARQSAFTKINLRLAIGSTDGTWELALAGKNLTDEYVSTFGGNAPLASALTGGTGNAYYTFVDASRNVTLQAVYHFGTN